MSSLFTRLATNITNAVSSNHNKNIDYTLINNNNTTTDTTANNKDNNKIINEIIAITSKSKV